MHYEEVLRLKPDNLAAHTSLAWLMEAARMDYASAAAHYREAIKGSPDNANALFNLALILQYHLKQPAEAEQAYRNSLKHDAADPEAWCVRACVHGQPSC